MNPALRGRELLLGLSLILGVAPAAQTAQLVSYKVEVAFSSATQASVIATFRVSRHDGDAALIVRMIRYPGQELEGAVARNTDEQFSSSTAFREEPAAFVADLGGAAGKGYSVTYTVSSNSRLRRVPLPVPEATPTSRLEPVEVRVSLPAGRVLVGDSFPLLTSLSPNGGWARLVAVPSVLEVQSAPANAVSLGDKFLNPTTVTTVAMIFVLGAGSAIWYRNSRRA